MYANYVYIRPIVNCTECVLSCFNKREISQSVRLLQASEEYANAWNLGRLRPRVIPNNSHRPTKLSRSSRRVGRCELGLRVIRSGLLVGVMRYIKLTYVSF